MVLGHLEAQDYHGLLYSLDDRRRLVGYTFESFSISLSLRDLWQCSAFD